MNFSTYKDLTLKTSRLYADKDHTRSNGISKYWIILITD